MTNVLRGALPWAAVYQALPLAVYQLDIAVRDRNFKLRCRREFREHGESPAATAANSGSDEPELDVAVAGVARAEEALTVVGEPEPAL